MKRGLALLLVLITCITFIPAISINANAETVDYVYGGKYIYNWGKRGETATYLSQNAEAFYDKYGSYTELSSYDGGSGKSDAPTSELYSALQDIMADAHNYETSYEATKELYRYTDCQNSGGAISSFYSGASIGPAWGQGSWNREHTWPDSKGLGGNDENDIMMLRPTASSENSSRGNTAYGESAGYYHPNNESNGAYDLRGDVARIFLYVYVRWGNVNGNGSYSTWGSNGVMESVEVMLKWIEEDPVDTWELGRNDSVESITGTRNVFVDYPELAFILFGEEIPADMSTPSGGSDAACDHNNFDSGVVVVATCTAKGYTLFTCQTTGCGYSYKTNVVAAKGHSYASGTCVNCGEAEPVKPAYVTDFTTGTAYKLGLFSTPNNCEYYFNGTMSGYYGATDTNYDNGVDVYVESATGGYRLYFNDASGKKQYINLVLSGEHYNFTYSTTATSVFTWDAEKSTFTTQVSGEACYIGNYGSYFSMNVLRSSKYQATDYVARLYTMNGSTGGGSTGSGSTGGGSTVTPCQHDYAPTVTLPGCTKDGFTTYTCLLCGDSYTGDKVAATGHNYVDNTCTRCGAVQSTGTASSAKIEFNSTANRVSLSESQQVWQQNGITVTNDKGGASSPVADYSDPVRFYAGSNVTIAYPGIIKIEIDCSGMESKYLTGWMNAPTGAIAENNNGIITVTFSSAVDSVVYTSLTKQSRAHSITVYTQGGTDQPTSCSHTNTKLEGVVSATCTSDGHTGKTVCSDCGAIVDGGQTVLKTGHRWIAADCDTPKTCSSCKATEGTALGHDWVEATADAPKTCDRCGITEGEKLPGTTPGGTDNPGTGTTDDDENKGNSNTPTEQAPKKDHSKCETNRFKAFWNSFLNFFRRIFTGKKKCPCGEFYE